MVTVKVFKTDQCVLCNRNAEGIEAGFGGLKGFLCKRCFFSALKARSPKPAVEKDKAVGAPNK